MKKATITRRNLLKAGALGAAVTIAAPKEAAAKIITDVKNIKWDKETDVLILGTGFAGLSAAIGAQEAGAKVLIIEKAPKQFEGGNSRVSAQLWWTPTNYEDGIAYLRGLNEYNPIPAEQSEWMVREMLKINQWLLDNFRVKALVLERPTVTPEHPKLPGSKGIKCNNNNGVNGNAVVWNPIRANVEKRGIEVMYETPGVELYQDANNRILGVRATRDGRDFNIKANRGVVLACGGFEHNKEMLRNYLVGDIYFKGTQYNTGDGIRMSQAVGAKLWHMNHYMGAYEGMQIPEYPWPTGIVPSVQNFVYLNKKGKRFMPEDRPGRHGAGHREYAMFHDGIELEWPNNPIYVIMDKNMESAPLLAGGIYATFSAFNLYSNYKWSKDNSQEVKNGWIVKADTLEELAKKLGLPEDEVVKSINRYNEMVQAGEDKDFGRKASHMKPVAQAPFYAYLGRPLAYNTQGGPQRNKRSEIMDAFDRIIPGLFSAGELGSAYAWVYNAGGNVCECFYTGLEAGRNAAAMKSW